MRKIDIKMFKSNTHLLNGFLSAFSGIVSYHFTAPENTIDFQEIEKQSDTLGKDENWRINVSISWEKIKKLP